MSRPEAHRLDELSAGYSLAGCSPAAPASAFPAVSEYCNSVARKSTIFQRTVTVSLCCCITLGVHTIVLLAATELGRPVSHNVDRDRLAAHRRLLQTNLWPARFLVPGWPWHQYGATALAAHPKKALKSVVLTVVYLDPQQLLSVWRGLIRAAASSPRVPPSLTHRPRTGPARLSSKYDPLARQVRTRVGRAPPTA